MNSEMVGNDKAEQDLNHPHRMVDATDTTRPPYGPLNDDILTRERALELAAQCWCDPRTSNRVMDPALAEVFAELLMKVASEGHALGVAGE